MTLPANKKGKRTNASGRRGGDKGSRPDFLGTLLHNVYDATLAEETPPEMLDLLGKLR